MRSSAVGEDSADATFAGMQETLPARRGADAVLRSGPRLLGEPPQRARDRLPRADGAPATPEMGVTVQRMVDADVSGVLFTCNPVSGDPSTVAINASWGLGLAVVGGEVTPDEYLVSKVTGDVVHEAVGDKHVEYRGGGAAARSTTSAAEQPCLDDEQLDALLDLAKRVQRALRLASGRRVGVRATASCTCSSRGR